MKFILSFPEMCARMVWPFPNIYLECGVGQRLYDGTLDFDHIGFCQVLSLLVWITCLAKDGEGLTKFTIRDILSASDLFGRCALGCRDEFHVLAFLSLRALQAALPAVRQQKEVPFCLQDEEELSFIPAGSRFHNV